MSVARGVQRQRQHTGRGGAEDGDSVLLGAEQPEGVRDARRQRDQHGRRQSERRREGGGVPRQQRRNGAVRV